MTLHASLSAQYGDRGGLFIRPPSHFIQTVRQNVCDTVRAENAPCSAQARLSARKQSKNVPRTMWDGCAIIRLTG